MKLVLKVTQIALCCGLWMGLAHANCPSILTATRFAFSADGSEVIDKITGLIWARCHVGQTWSGNTCTGTATTMWQDVALTTAQAQSGWRVPNIKELGSLVDEGCANPAIDTAAFPGQALTVWSSTPVTRSPYNAWGVNFSSGEVGDSGNGAATQGADRTTPQAVRLVRIAP